MSSNTVVSQLPIGSGGSSTTNQQMNAVNTQLAMMAAQAKEDSKYDPKPPKPVTSAQIIQPFCNRRNTLDTVATSLAVIGAVCIVYGIITK
jgi:hypothetical protein